MVALVLLAALAPPPLAWRRGQAQLVFGGAAGIPPGLTNAVAASTGTLSLNNGGDTVRVDDAGGAGARG